MNLAKFNHFTIFSRYITGISWAEIKNWVLKARLWLPLNRLFLLVFDWSYVYLCGSYVKGVKMHWPLPTQRGHLYSLLTQYRIIRQKEEHVTFSLILTDLGVDASSLHTRSPFYLLLLWVRSIFKLLYISQDKNRLHLLLYILIVIGNV